MLNPRLAYRYAKALLDIAIEKGQLDRVFTDVQWLKEVCQQSSDFVSLLRSPIIKADKKQKIVDAITKDSISEITNGFIRLLISKVRESHLPEMLNEFVKLYKQHKNISTVKLTTAVPVSDAVKDGIIAQVKKAADIENVELEETVNPDIIGGFVLEMGDKMIDASIAYDLREVAKQFKNNDFIYKVR
ncbi:ATP synthase F1 subunit delta [Niabella ginsengisoli]|uniref:ATP synthase subunit delta n=1 Tax=Niabella ginsengisoli TaxID=522298 RepID=A0ABS9SEU1_9BACT|nr:ATP synthase F1 subunit delta [Niabella ginsengisoli]MCH5596873.1 ATP synthase F1 subunit delta [Niabella ginsengisoli]